MVMVRVLAALGFVLRALVPAGFMPDAHAMQAGHIELTLCSPGKMGKAVAIDWPSNDPSTGLFGSAAGIDVPASPHPEGSLATPAGCAFSLIAAQGVIAPPDHAVVHAATSFVPLTRLTPLISHALPAEGPPLGSRAPPAAA